MLEAAENPPAPRWRYVSRPIPTDAGIRAAAAATVRTPAWQLHRDMLTSHEDQVRAATPGAACALFAAWDAMPEREMANKERWEAGQRPAERWRPVLDKLAPMLDAVDARPKDILAKLS